MLGRKLTRGVAPCRVVSRGDGNRPVPRAPVVRHPRILIVDADGAMARAVAEHLAGHGFAVEVALDGSSHLLREPDSYDAVVLELDLPSGSGFDVLRAIRDRADVPVLLLTARDTEVDRIVGFELGADDFVSKPPSLRELAARLHVVLRRAGGSSAPSAPASLVVGDVRLEAACRLAWRAGKALNLTTAEFNLLEALLSAAGRIVTRDDLWQAAFGCCRTSCGGRNVDNVVLKLRRKLGPDGPIRTIRNLGYLYATPIAAQGGAN